jgi:hypothetical protein
MPTAVAKLVWAAVARVMNSLIPRSSLPAPSPLSNGRRPVYLQRNARMDRRRTADYQPTALALKVVVVCFTILWAYAVGIVLSLLHAGPS